MLLTPTKIGAFLPGSKLISVTVDEDTDTSLPITTGLVLMPSLFSPKLNGSKSGELLFKGLRKGWREGFQSSGKVMPELSASRLRSNIENGLKVVASSVKDIVTGFGVCFFSSSAHLSIRDWVFKIGFAIKDGVVSLGIDEVVGCGIGGPAIFSLEIWNEVAPSKGWLTVVIVVLVVG